MTSILTWNIQCGLGCDAAHDLERIAGQIKNNGDPDVICLQEVVRFMPELDAGRSEDQVALLSGLFPGFAVMYGAAIDQAEDGGGAAAIWQSDPYATTGFAGVLSCVATTSSSGHKTHAAADN